MNSRFEHAFHTNYAPSQEELREIEDLVSAPEEKIQLLNEKISQLQAERDGLQSFIDNHRALLSPARRLPRDILAEIFLHCLPTDRLPSCDGRKAPLVLTTICRFWREIAVTTPRLWRAIHFIIPILTGYIIHDDFRKQTRLHNEGLQLWLERAKSVPLTISCYMPSSSDKPMEIREGLQNTYSESLEILLRYSVQWKTLCLSFIPRQLLLLFLKLKPSDIPLLRTLYLERNTFDFWRPWMSTTEGHPLSDIARVASLRALYLQSEYVDIAAFPARWGELTELSITLPLHLSYDVSPAEFVQKLSQTCHSLRKCALNLAITPPENLVSIQSPRQTWKYLSDFSIHFEINDMPEEHSQAFQILERVFDPIATPALSHFTFRTSIMPLEIERAPFLTLFEVSNCHIISLELETQLSEKALVETLRCIPSLAVFHLVDIFQSSSYVIEGVVIHPPPYPALTSNLFRALAEDVLCPLLEEVNLEHCTADCMDDIVAFVRARSTIKSLNVTFKASTAFMVQYTLSDEERHKGELLRQRGIDVVWRSVSESTFDFTYNAVFDAGMPQLISFMY
ncbi:hypothetical protein VNI00_013828 [Paramarasmius palmivorus]|uniref:F-box domain-containing protein n=1 Tax=Paramarasmius palmivorus TaxID=297713 RepID=A0AAW0BW53_9AGAR